MAKPKELGLGRTIFHVPCTMAPKKKADNRPPIFVAIDKGDDDAVQELITSDPANRDSKNKVNCSFRCPYWNCQA